MASWADGTKGVCSGRCRVESYDTSEGVPTGELDEVLVDSFVASGEDAYVVERQSKRWDGEHVGMGPVG